MASFFEDETPKNEEFYLNIKTPKKYKRRLSKTPSTDNRLKGNELSIENLLNLKYNELEDILFKTPSSHIRKILEPLSAKKQCENVIGECNINQSNITDYNFSPEENEKNSYCWLCGTSFYCRTKAIDCEHIIPLLFAVLFLGIDTNTQIKTENNFTNELINAYNANYLYAHSSCNRKKSNLLLIEWDEENKEMIFNQTNANILQERILKSTLINVQNNFKTHGETYKSAMMENFKSKIQIICDLINSEYQDILEDKDETGYVKYIISMSKIYLSKKHIENLQNDIEIRNKLTKYLANPTNNKNKIENEMKNIKEEESQEISQTSNNSIIKEEMQEIENIKEEEKTLLTVNEKNILYNTAKKLRKSENKRNYRYNTIDRLTNNIDTPLKKSRKYGGKNKRPKKNQRKTQKRKSKKNHK